MAVDKGRHRHVEEFLGGGCQGQLVMLRGSAGASKGDMLTVTKRTCFIKQPYSAACSQACSSASSYLLGKWWTSIRCRSSISQKRVQETVSRRR